MLFLKRKWKFINKKLPIIFDFFTWSKPCPNCDVSDVTSLMVLLYETHVANKKYRDNCIHIKYLSRHEPKNIEKHSLKSLDRQNLGYSSVLVLALQESTNLVFTLLCGSPTIKNWKLHNKAIYPC